VNNKPSHRNFIFLRRFLPKVIIHESYHFPGENQGENDFVEISKNLAKSENNFVRPSK